MLKYAILSFILLLVACAEDKPIIEEDPTQNYLTPIPLSELGDSVLESHFPSLEGTLIATKEFKARFEAYKDLVYAEYRKMPVWQGDAKPDLCGDAEIHGIPEYYLTNADKDMWVIDSMFAKDMLDSNFYRGGGGGHHFFENPEQTRLLFLAFAEEKKTHLKKGIDKEYSQLLKLSCPNVNSLASIFYMKREAASEGNYIRQQHYITPPKAIQNQYVYQQTIMSQKGYNYGKNCFVTITNKNIKDYEPFIVVYCEKLQIGHYLVFDSKTGIYTSTAFALPPNDWPMHIIAMAESTDGQMLAGIRPFMVSDTTHYEMELQPMKWEDFNAAVNALK